MLRQCCSKKVSLGDAIARRMVLPPPLLWTLVLALLVYTTVWPLDRLPGGDSGELLAEACVGGVAHPPGYPLLISLLHLVRWTAQQCYTVITGNGDNSMHFVQLANSINAFIAASAAACVTHTVHLMTSKHSSVEAVAAGLSFALSKLTWEYARGVEVFALNDLLVGVLHILVVKHAMQPTTKNACLGAFVCGLGLANQHTIGNTACCLIRTCKTISNVVCGMRVCCFCYHLVLFEAPFILWVLLTHRFRVVELFMVAMA